MFERLMSGWSAGRKSLLRILSMIRKLMRRQKNQFEPQNRKKEKLRMKNTLRKAFAAAAASTAVFWTASVSVFAIPYRGDNKLKPSDLKPGELYLMADDRETLTPDSSEEKYGELVVVLDVFEGDDEASLRGVFTTYIDVYFVLEHRIDCVPSTAYDFCKIKHS